MEVINTSQLKRLFDSLSAEERDTAIKKIKSLVSAGKSKTESFAEALGYESHRGLLWRKINPK